jgi:hypothetical protein
LLGRPTISELRHVLCAWRSTDAERRRLRDPEHPGGRRHRHAGNHRQDVAAGDQHHRDRKKYARRAAGHIEA